MMELKTLWIKFWSNQREPKFYQDSWLNIEKDTGLVGTMYRRGLETAILS
jgi:hypothetical protein